MSWGRVWGDRDKTIALLGSNYFSPLVDLLTFNNPMPLLVEMHYLQIIKIKQTGNPILSQKIKNAPSNSPRLQVPSTVWQPTLQDQSLNPTSRPSVAAAALNQLILVTVFSQRALWGRLAFSHHQAMLHLMPSARIYNIKL